MRFMLAKEYDGRDPAGWMMAEKLDGFRAYWTGTELISRNGNPFQAPQWWKARLPDLPLDGELYAGRGGLSTVAGTVRKAIPLDADWRRIRYMVFDAPAVDGVFETRLEAARKAIDGAPVAELVEHRPCSGRAELAGRFRAVVAAGGEGLMLRRPGSRYEGRRSDTLLKVKQPPEAAAGCSRC